MPHERPRIQPCRSPRRRGRRERRPHGGFTLVELMVVVAIIGILGSLAVVAYTGYLKRARINRAIQDIQAIELSAEAYEGAQHEAPPSLAAMGFGGQLDPWGNPYQYNRLDLVPPGRWRKDHSLVPLNTVYDLWSNGEDGLSQAPLTPPVSRDDIIRANDGGFIGLASDY